MVILKKDTSQYNQDMPQSLTGQMLKLRGISTDHRHPHETCADRGLFVMGGQGPSDKKRSDNVFLVLNLFYRGGPLVY